MRRPFWQANGFVCLLLCLVCVIARFAGGEPNTVAYPLFVIGMLCFAEAKRAQP